MIYVNNGKLKLTKARITKIRALKKQLAAKAPGEKSAFIDTQREHTWGHKDLVRSLRALVGNKCWYSEVPLEGADPNVDHFRPKGRVSEIDDNLKPTGVESPGYWWLAFEPHNFRLCSMHSNQRRVDERTDGGKWDYFPVDGARAIENTPIGAICENALVLDPCSLTDVELLFFDSDGHPGPSEKAEKSPDPDDVKRVRVSIWLFHLDKNEIVSRRAGHIVELRTLLTNADAQHFLWRRAGKINHQARVSFNAEVAKIRAKLADDAPFAGALRCVATSAIVDYPWLTEFRLI
jgi:hypothetical protein